MVGRFSYEKAWKVLKRSMQNVSYFKTFTTDTFKWSGLMEFALQIGKFFQLMCEKHYSGGPFVRKRSFVFFFFVKIDLVPDSASKYQKNIWKIGCYFFILRLTDKISKTKWPPYGEGAFVILHLFFVKIKNNAWFCFKIY